VEIPAAEVAHRVATAVELLPLFRSRRTAIDLKTGDAAERLLRLARWAKACRLAPESKGCLQEVIGLAPDHAAAHAALGHVRFRGSWMARATAMRRKGFVHFDGRWMLPAEADHYRRKNAQSKPAETATVKRRERAGFAAALVRGEPGTAERFAAQSAEEQLRILLAGLSHTDAAVRRALTQRLSARRDLRVVRALTWQSVRDSDASARAAALAALNTLKYDRTPLYYGSGLRAKDEKLRVRAIEALGTFSDNPIAPRVLADTWIEGWGGGPRVNLMVGSSIAYIRDFSVEVAQSAAIADPEVGVLHEAAVLDFQVQGVRQRMSSTESRAYRKSMQQLVGKDLGAEPRQWVDYLNRGHDLRKGR
jgi:hypothetical protein